jgi:pantothenate synthetase
VSHECTAQHSRNQRVEPRSREVAKRFLFILNPTAHAAQDGKSLWDSGQQTTASRLRGSLFFLRQEKDEGL